MKTDQYHAGFINGFIVGSVTGVFTVGAVLCLMMLFR